jgi:AcrR family transcriptional regulator
MDKPSGTKQKIIDAAIDLFSEKSYSIVTVRDIAKAVDIKPASLYSHFASKDEILDYIYAIYEQNLVEAKPNLEHLMKLAETEHPHSVLMKTNFHYAPEVQEQMDRILIIAANLILVDERSEEFIARNIYSLPESIMGKLLHYMQELGRIEPMDVDAFVSILTNISYSAALRNFTKHPVTYDEWYRCMALLYKLVKPTGQ